MRPLACGKAFILASTELWVLSYINIFEEMVRRGNAKHVL